MGCGTRMLRAVAMGPAVVMSSAAWLMLAALLPIGAGGLVLVVAPVVLAVLWFSRSGRVGRLVEQVGVLLAGAREPTAEELETLRPVLVQLVDLEVDSMQLLIGRFEQRSPLVRPFGRDQVVVSPVLIEALRRRQLAVEDAVALITHDIGWLRAEPTRGAVAIAAWTLPWRALSAVASRLGTAARWVPVVAFAWKLRPVVGTLAVVQSAVEGRMTSSVLIAALLTVTYTTPAARRARDERLQMAADLYVIDRGLGSTLLGALVQVGAPRPEVERIHRLQAGVRAEPLSGSPTEPVIRLVPS